MRKNSGPVKAIAVGLLLITSAVQAQVLVQGHRGARGVRPENTLAAFQYALEIGVDVLELDLVVSKDDHLVIHHDPWVNAELCLKDGKPIAPRQPIRSLTLQQLKQFDCGSLPNPRFPEQVLQPGQRMPTLAELFRLVEDSPLPVARRVGFNIETKIVPRQPQLTPTPEHYARLLVREIEAAGLRDRVVVQSFDYRTLKWVKQLDPAQRVSQLTYRNYVDLVAAARSIDADYLSPDWESITADMVREFHAAELRVAPWTANTEESWEYLIGIGVDEIITDYPRKLMHYLRSLGSE